MLRVGVLPQSGELRPVRARLAVVPELWVDEASARQRERAGQLQTRQPRFGANSVMSPPGPGMVLS
jgi:hypothetical protein